MKKIEDNHTLVFTADVKANKHQIKQARKKLCEITVAKANTLMKPDGKKKADTRLLTVTPWILPTRLGSSKQSSCLILNIIVFRHNKIKVKEENP